MKCEELQDTLSEYLDGEVKESSRKEAIEKHLADCATCRALLEDLRGLQGAVRSLPMLRAPKDLGQQVARMIEKEARIIPFAAPAVQEVRPAWTYRIFAPIALAAAAALLAVFVVLQVTTRSREEAPAITEVAAAKKAEDAEAFTGSKLTPLTETERETQSAEVTRQGPDLAAEKARKTDALDLGAAPPTPGLIAPQVTLRPQDGGLREAAPQKPATLEDRIPPLVAQHMGEADKAREPAPRAEPSGASSATPREKGVLSDAIKSEKPASESKPQTEISLKDVERQSAAAPTVDASNILRGMVEKRTLLLRVEDVPAATAEVKGMLARYGAQISRDYYANGRLEGAGSQIKAQLPGVRYQAFVNELRQKKYLASERTKSLAKSAHPRTTAAPMSLKIAETIDLTIQFQAQ